MADTLKVHFVKSTAEDGIVDLVPTGVTSTKTILSMVIGNVGETTANDATFDIYIYGVGYEDGSSGNTNIRSENLKNRLYVDEFNLASDSATFDRKLNAMSTAVQNVGLLHERAKQYQGQQLLADAVGRNGINTRQQLRGDMLTKYHNRTINGIKFSDMNDADQSAFIANVTNNNLNVLDLFD